MPQLSSAALFVPGVLVAGKYHLLRSVGEGAMGSVWAAINKFTGREVALKLIVRTEPEFRRRLEREARALGTLKHRNIVDVYDVGQTDTGDPFLVMQLLAGENLAELLGRKRNLAPSAAAYIGRDVAKALGAAHAVRIVHRDIKPANIFLHQDPDEAATVIKVLDFGVSKNLAASDGLRTAVGGVVGSLLYMSPEQVSSAAEVDHRADIWAIGVVMFEMLTGRRPFNGDVNEVFTRILGGEIPSVDRYVRRIDSGLVQVVARCMRRRREERYASAAEVAAALEPFVGAACGAQAQHATMSPPADWARGSAPSHPGPGDSGDGLGPASAVDCAWTEGGTLRMLPRVAGVARPPAAAVATLPKVVVTASPLAVPAVVSSTMPVVQSSHQAVDSSAALLGERRRRTRMVAAAAGVSLALVTAAGALLLRSGAPEGPAAPEMSARTVQATATYKPILQSVEPPQAATAPAPLPAPSAAPPAPTATERPKKQGQSEPCAGKTSILREDCQKKPGTRSFDW